MDDILKSAFNLEDSIRAWRRDLHRIPEVGLDTPLTEAYICARLDEIGVSYARGVGGHGVVAAVGGKKDGRCFAIRCDCDGLPIREESGEPFASQNGCMHACGHDAHTAIGLATAALLKSRESGIAGTVKIIFQPGEETGEGAMAMIAGGCLDDPTVDVIASLHVSPHWCDDLTGDKMGFRPGGLLACMDKFTVRVDGRISGKGRASSSVAASCCRIISELQTIVPCDVDPLEPAVVSVCQVDIDRNQEGKEEGMITGTARALSRDTRNLLERRIADIVERIDATTEVRAESCYTRGAPPVINDSGMAGFMEKTASSLFGEESVVRLKAPVMGGEDFAYYLEKIPGVMLFFSTEPREGGIVSAHNGKYRIYDGELWRGAALFAQAALSWLAGSLPSETGGL